MHKILCPKEMDVSHLPEIYRKPLKLGTPPYKVQNCWYQWCPIQRRPIVFQCTPLIMGPYSMSTALGVDTQVIQLLIELMKASESEWSNQRQEDQIEISTRKNNNVIKMIGIYQGTIATVKFQLRSMSGTLLCTCCKMSKIGFRYVATYHEMSATINKYQVIPRNFIQIHVLQTKLSGIECHIHDMQQVWLEQHMKLSDL